MFNASAGSSSSSTHRSTDDVANSSSKSGGGGGGGGSASMPSTAAPFNINLLAAAIVEPPERAFEWRPLKGYNVRPLIVDGITLSVGLLAIGSAHWLFCESDQCWSFIPGKESAMAYLDELWFS